MPSSVLARGPLPGFQHRRDHECRVHFLQWGHQQQRQVLGAINRRNGILTHPKQIGESPQLLLPRRDIQDDHLRLIFPGSQVLSLPAMSSAWARSSDLRLTDLEEITRAG